MLTRNPHIVTDCTQYNDSQPFQPLQLPCVVIYLDKLESTHEKLNAIEIYWIHYKQGDKEAIISFGLGADVAVTSIIGPPTLRQWGGHMDFSSNRVIASISNTKFNLHYEQTN